MHEATWQRLMRSAFFACCVLPTLVVLGWIAWHASPLQVARWEHSLRQSLGLVVRIQRVSYPKPGHVRLHGLRLLDPTTHELLADSPQLDAFWSEERCVVRMVEAAVAADRSLAAWPIWHDRILRDEMLAGRSAELRIDRLELRTAPVASAPVGPAPVETASAELTADESAPAVAVGAEVDGPGASSLSLHAVRWKSWVEQSQRQSQRQSQLELRRTPVEAGQEGVEAEGDPAGRVLMTVHRSLEDGVAVTHVVLESGAEAIAPQRLAAQLGMPWEERMKFTGTLRLALEPSRWSGQFKGQVTEIDLGAWSEGRLPYPVDGQASVTLHQCDFGVSGVQRAVGELQVSDGRFDRLLLEALVRNGLAVAGEAFAALPADEPVSQVEMQLQFGLNEMGLVTRGVVDEQGREVAARGPTGILLLKPASTRHLDALVRALVYPARPASDEASQKMWRVAYNIKRLLPSLPELSSARPEAAPRK